MSVIKNLLIFWFVEELNKVYNNRNVSINTINKFYYSLLKYNFFLKFTLISYLLLLIFTNILLSIILFFKLRYKYFGIILKFFRKIPILKNIQNFLIANLLLHTN